MSLSPYGQGWPLASDGMTIGLLGGSFNPPHQGHVALSELALKRLGLDQVWWLVTPGNPLKENDNLPDQDVRIAASKALMRSPRIVVTGLESITRTRFTLDTVRAIQARYRGVRFVWLMGADNLAQFHRWLHWRVLAQEVAIAVIDRPGSSLRACHSPAALALARYRVPEDQALVLTEQPRPAWCFLHGLKSPLSSTQIRVEGKEL